MHTIEHLARAKEGCSLFPATTLIFTALPLPQTPFEPSAGTALLIGNDTLGVMP